MRCLRVSLKDYISIHWRYSTCYAWKLEPSKQQKKTPSNARGQTWRVLLVKDFIGLIDWNLLKLLSSTKYVLNSQWHHLIFVFQIWFQKPLLKKVIPSKNWHIISTKNVWIPHLEFWIPPCCVQFKIDPSQPVPTKMLPLQVPQSDPCKGRFSTCAPGRLVDIQ